MASAAQNARSDSSDGFYLSQEELAKLTPAELHKRISEIVPMIAAHAAESEKLRKPVPEVFDALRSTGYFYQFVPKAYGGMEIDIQSCIDINMLIADVDPSLCWATSFVSCHNLLLTRFPEATQKKLWGGDFPYLLVPYTAAPPGTATPVEGGYRVTGRWKWGTGIMNADWYFALTLRMEEGKDPVPMIALMPIQDVSVEDVWHISGMCGTGSNDIIVEDVFVPNDHMIPAFSGTGTPPSANIYNSNVFGAPLVPFFAVLTALPPLGAVRSMLAAYKDRLSKHVRLGSVGAQADKVGPQLRLAKADLIVSSAETLVRDAASEFDRVALIAEPEQSAARSKLRGQVCYAVSLMREAALLLNEGAGTSAHMSDAIFQRSFRDLLVMSTHIMFDVDVAYEQHGRGMLGLEPNSSLN